MRDFNEFLIENDQQLFTEIFGTLKKALGMDKPEWHSYLKNLARSPSDGPVATQLLSMFTKGMQPQDYQWIKANQNAVWKFLKMHRNQLEGMGMNIDGLIKKLGVYDPHQYRATGSTGGASWDGGTNVSAHDVSHGNVKIR